jgi:hypothetical protein
LPRLTRSIGNIKCIAKKIEASVAAFIRRNGIARCPTASALSTQATSGATDRVGCSAMRHCAVSLAASSSTCAIDRSGPPTSGRDPVTSALERSPPDALAMSDDLPPPNTQRWVVRRKAAVITAVRSGRITLEEALRRYNLTEEEYRSWERAFDEHGLPGLRSTRLQQYRGPRPSRRPRSRR